jgi:hypothetical protein
MEMVLPFLVSLSVIQMAMLMVTRSLLGVVVFGVTVVLVPADDPQAPDDSIDYIGAYLGVTGLILFNFSWKYVYKCFSAT